MGFSHERPSQATLMHFQWRLGRSNVNRLPNLTPDRRPILTSLSGVICRGVVARLPTLEIVKPRFLILIRPHPLHERKGKARTVNALKANAAALVITACASAVLMRDLT